jgi:hypothetical protein
MAERGGFTACPPAYVVGNERNVPILMQIGTLAEFLLGLSVPPKSACCPLETDTK